MTTETTIDNSVLIEEMLADAKSVAREPEVVHKGDEDLPVPMVMSVKDGDLCIIYEAKTGEPLKVLRYMLADLLRATNPDGTRRFVTHTSKTPYRGSLKCLLHSEGPDRRHYDELGLPVCRKANLNAPYMVEQHMKKRHPTAWAIIERERIDAEKKEQKEHDRKLLGQIAHAALGKSKKSK